MHPVVKRGLVPDNEPALAREPEIKVPIVHSPDFFAPSAPLDTLGNDRRTLEFAKLFQGLPPRHHALLRNLMMALGATT